MRFHVLLDTADLSSIADAAERVCHDLGPAGAKAVWKLYASARREHPSGYFSLLPAESDELLARLARWEGQASVLGRSLRASGIVDADGRLIGWRATKERFKDNQRERERKREWWRKHHGKGSKLDAPSADGASPSASSLALASTGRGEKLDPSRGKTRRVEVVHKAVVSKKETMRKMSRFEKMAASDDLILNEPPHTPPPHRQIERGRRITSLSEEECSEPSAPRAPLAALAPVLACAVAPLLPKPIRIDAAKLTARRVVRKAERRASSAQERLTLAQERQALGVTEDSVPAAGIDKGALCGFAEEPEFSTALREARRAFRRYRDLADGRPFTGPVPPERVQNLARICYDRNLSCGSVLEKLHRQAREVAHLRSAPVSMLAPAALDAAALEAESSPRPPSSRKGEKPPSEASRGHAPVGYVDARAVDPRVITALREAGASWAGRATEAEWALAAQANARGLASGLLRRRSMSPASLRAAEVAARVLGMEIP